jgi:hypothetical protein
MSSAGSSIVTLSDNAAIDTNVERWVGSLQSLNLIASSILKLLLPILRKEFVIVTHQNWRLSE